MSEDNNNNNWRDRVKSPSKRNEKMIGGKNSLPKKDGRIDRNQIQEDFEKKTPKSKGWQGRGGRGGGYIPKPFQEMIKRKQILPPTGPLSENIESPKLPETQREEKEKTMIAMKDIEIDKPSLINEEPSLEKGILNDKIKFEDTHPNNIEKIMLAMRDIEDERPTFLKDIQPEPFKSIEMPEPSMEGDSSDGGDGGGDGGE